MLLSICHVYVNPMNQETAERQATFASFTEEVLGLDGKCERRLSFACIAKRLSKHAPRKQGLTCVDF